ncbi:MAG: diphosphomevalonate decarboxylase [Anaerolineales bacterium]|nr:diphosphomevalonate decarboxylase [Anaerolineales bacterium]MCX7608255.1 diphosphomevalonate decarboxylase [Anaerolineales bacterium]MDW8226751.1 diphosphomevalonate decarboxylase [Anaerolineales bacterium]
MSSATALAHPNIALIKYWGNRDEALRLPVNGSLSMNLAGLETRTTVTWGQSETDRLTINGIEVQGASLKRVSDFLDLVRQMAGLQERAMVESQNNFPVGTGIASSASAFAALALAATAAAGLELEPAALSRLARRGSGSACRSVPDGFVEWLPGSGDDDSFAISIAPPEHWPLVDVIVIFSSKHKETGSTEGHRLAATSPLQAARIADAPRRLEICRRAILQRDFSAFAEVVELDSTMMHAVMMTSTPPLFYWQPATLEVLNLVRQARAQGTAACATVDAGPNVHIICEESAAKTVLQLLSGLSEIQEVRLTHVGRGARLISS